MLNDILEHTRKDLEALKQRTSLAEISRLAEAFRGSKRSLLKALSKNRKLHLICELKKASPSEGLLRKDFDPVVLAQDFEAAGASAISVLTEKHYFMGNPETIKRIRSFTTIPLLRKDFIIDPYQVYETATLEADAFLLIAMLLSGNELKQMLHLALKLNLDTLVEVHTKEELERAIDAGAKIIGINNRNLQTLKVDLSVSEYLLRFIPKGTIAVIESGIETPEEIARYQQNGAHCFLVGTTLMKSINVRAKILELSGRLDEASHGKS
ncbi:MAG: hypothetical protein A3C35_06060 [Omnitrophica bacterium RIFCSPHIGHO2_02_FULL_46_11]|nr:MAG: hypothetical protein A3C35_06060 [Omnitrophica bacterium RIFCSPHIGHO2_02_FULL_46_11]OGW86323.1 MAG: hypothetical protein A3A81_07540 [Omnitrophica bacterium RIFCSPLOWO2_01_FULL_45_10b]